MNHRVQGQFDPDQKSHSQEHLVLWHKATSQRGPKHSVSMLLVFQLQCMTWCCATSWALQNMNFICRSSRGCRCRRHLCITLPTFQSFRLCWQTTVFFQKILGLQQASEQGENMTKTCGYNMLQVKSMASAQECISIRFEICSMLFPSYFPKERSIRRHQHIFSRAFRSDHPKYRHTTKAGWI